MLSERGGDVLDAPGWYTGSSCRSACAEIGGYVRRGRMSLSQDQSDVSYRPMRWIYGTGIALFLSGIVFSVWMNLSSSDTRSSLFRTGLFLFEVLFTFTIFTLPGVLVAFRHPWGAAFRLQLEQQRIAHPRLYGVAAV
jgi:hypothetical protein